MNNKRSLVAGWDFSYVNEEEKMEKITILKVLYSDDVEEYCIKEYPNYRSNVKVIQESIIKEFNI